VNVLVAVRVRVLVAGQRQRHNLQTIATMLTSSDFASFIV
jgi:hypothetical protein